jgi:2-iminobutanoate/2-iminopropanoate deaminase
MSGELRFVKSDGAPEAIGPYSQAVLVGEWVFCSGQIPVDPGDGEIVAGGIGQQTDRVLVNLQAVLSEAGSSLEHVVKTTVFPARSTVEAGALPRGSLVEIECIARSIS